MEAVGDKLKLLGYERLIREHGLGRCRAYFTGADVGSAEACSSSTCSRWFVGCCPFPSRRTARPLTPRSLADARRGRERRVRRPAGALRQAGAAELLRRDAAAWLRGARGAEVPQC